MTELSRVANRKVYTGSNPVLTTNTRVAKLADAIDGYSTMCKKAYDVCGHYNGSTITGSNPVTGTSLKIIIMITKQQVREKIESIASLPPHPRRQAKIKQLRDTGKGIN